jgi:hypothetical protein
MIIVVRRLSMLAVMLATLVLVVLVVSSPAGAAAVPPGNVNWSTIEGTCGGQPAQILDPRGGNTAFLVGGSVIVGKVFTAIDNDTGQVLDQTVTGQGIDQARLITCVFLFPDTTIPGLGTIDLRFEVQALATPQGG